MLQALAVPKELLWTTGTQFDFYGGGSYDCGDTADCSAPLLNSGVALRL